MRGMDTQQQISTEKPTNYIQTRILPALGGQGPNFTLELISPGSRNIIWLLNRANSGRSLDHLAAIMSRNS